METFTPFFMAKARYEKAILRKIREVRVLRRGAEGKGEERSAVRMDRNKLRI